MNDNSLAPIVLFVYNRPWHTDQTLNALMKNDLADQSMLFIYSDGPKAEATQEQLNKITEVRELIRKEKWCKDVHIIESEKNKGLADSIVDGVTEIVNKYGKAIVLEDDIVTSRGFLKYMNDALNLYERNETIFQISAFMFPIDIKDLPETFFYNANTCWGWGTWQRAWKYYNNNALELYIKLIENNIDWEIYNAFQGNAYKEQLYANIENRLYTWAVKWHSTIILNDAFVLHPRKSLTKNIGFDNSGVNCKTDERFDQMELADSIKVESIKQIVNQQVACKIIDYFQNPYKIKPEKKSILKKILLKIISRL